jgi:hypothetical protein
VEPRVGGQDAPEEPAGGAVEARVRQRVGPEGERPPLPGTINGLPICVTAPRSVDKKDGGLSGSVHIDLKKCQQAAEAAQESVITEA